MLRAMALAKLGLGKVSPNPMVGCVIVENGEIIGQGYHQQFGGAHAEVNAIKTVSDENRLKHATVYVNLEPCAHFGKTPPCADLLIEKQVKRVVVANVDPNPLVGGKGLIRISQAGILVEHGVCKHEGYKLNEAFFTAFTKKRPLITLKWAQTADGFFAPAHKRQQWITNSVSRTIVHKLRAAHDAILVGKNTAMIDNPALDVRFWSGKNPRRLFIDKQLELPENAHLLDQSIPTYCFNQIKEEQLPNLHYVKLEADSDQYPSQIVTFLHNNNIQSVLVEGGAKLLQTFIDANLWDNMHVFISKKQLFHDGIKAPNTKGTLVHTQQFFDDHLLTFQNNII